MTAKEMYIRVTNDLQALGSQRSRKYYPEQIELELNNEVEAFINSVLKVNDKGFYTVEGYMDAVQPLIVPVWLPVYTEGGTYQAELPLNQYKLLGMGASLVDCYTLKSTDYLVKSFDYLKLPFTGTTIATGPFYKDVTLTVNGTVVYSRPGGGYSLKDIHHLIDELTSEVSSIGWEAIPGAYSPGAFLIKAERPGATASTAVLSFDGLTFNFSFSRNKLSNEMKAPSTLTSVPVRRLKNQHETTVLSTAYYKPSNVELPVTIHGNLVDLFTPKNSIVNRLFLSYVRKPRKISLSLNVGCDLAPGVHGMICDRTVQRIRERIGDPKYQTGLVQESKP